MLEDFFHHFTMELVPVYLKTQLRGVRVDPWRRAELKDELSLQKQDAISRLEAFAGTKLVAKKNLSNPALLNLLYNKLALPKQYHPKTHKLTANKEALEKLEAKVDDVRRPIFTDILSVRDLGVLINTFLDARLDPDGRLRWSNNLAGTVSGRLSTSGSPWWTGTNIQNWNEEVRDIVVSDEGTIFLYVDGEQAEARVVAFLSQDRNYISLFERGISIHKHLGAKIFNKPLEEIHKDTYEYATSKRGVHAKSYGMGVRRAAIIFKCTEHRAREILNAVDREFPGIGSTYHASIREDLGRSRTLFTPFGRRRQFFGRWGDELFKAAYSYIPQSTVADWLNFGLLRLVRFAGGTFSSLTNTHVDEWLSLPELRFAKTYPDLICPSLIPVANQHDGLLVQVKLEELERAITLMREAHTFEIAFPAGVLTIPVDLKLGFRWGNLISATPEAVEWVKQ